MTSPTDEASRLLRLPIEWIETEDVDFPYRAEVDRVPLRIGINDFPDEPLFSLFRGDEHLADFDDWPAPWRR